MPTCGSSFPGSELFKRGEFILVLRQCTGWRAEKSQPACLSSACPPRPCSCRIACELSARQSQHARRRVKREQPKTRSRERARILASARRWAVCQDLDENHYHTNLREETEEVSKKRCSFISRAYAAYAATTEDLEHQQYDQVQRL